VYKLLSAYCLDLSYPLSGHLFTQCLYFFLRIIWNFIYTFSALIYPWQESYLPTCLNSYLPSAWTLIYPVFEFVSTKCLCLYLHIARTIKNPLVKILPTTWQNTVDESLNSHLQTHLPIVWTLIYQMSVLSSQCTNFFCLNQSISKTLIYLLSELFSKQCLNFYPTFGWINQLATLLSPTVQNSSAHCLSSYLPIVPTLI